MLGFRRLDVSMVVVDSCGLGGAAGWLGMMMLVEATVSLTVKLLWLVTVPSMK